MTVTALHPPTPTATAGTLHSDTRVCGERRNPAPLATMLAVLGRIASHAGGPLTLTVTEPGQTIYIAVETGELYDAWCREIAADGQAMHGTPTPFEAVTCLHGWSLTLIMRRPR